jgi:hypothetical protein
LSSSGGGLFGRPTTRKSPGRFLFAPYFPAARHFVRGVRRFQPALHFVVDVRGLRDFDAMGDAVLLLEPAGIDQTLRCFVIA